MRVRSLRDEFSQISLDHNSSTLLGRSKVPPGGVSRLRARKPSQLVPMLRNRVLMIGRMRELALYRAEVLRVAGFEVLAPETSDEAKAMIEHGDFDVAVLSYTLPSDTVEEMAEHLRDHCPDCPLVAIAETDRVDRRIAPQAIALAAEGPPGLLSALHKVLERR